MFYTDSNWVRAAGQTARLSLIALFVFGLAGCGIGGGVDSGSGFVASSGDKPQLEITTTSVPAGSPGAAFPPTQLEAVNAQGPLDWTVTGGTLPPGIELTSDGELLGTPASSGFYSFTARASDGQSADLQTFAIAVDAPGLMAADGLMFGDAWSGRAVTLQTAGFTGPISFSVAGNGSGGSLQQVDPSAGSAVWVPGAVGANGAVDVLRVMDVSGGTPCEIEINVVPNPIENHVARFGSTDVWFLDWDVKRGAHPYATDFQAALAHLGLRRPESTDAVGTQADRLAELVAKVAVLRAVNKVFLRDSDGSMGAQGLAISFPLERPGAGYVTTTAGGSVSGRPNGYSVMSLGDQSGNLGAIGMAIGDVPGNARHENNTTGASGELGVFMNYVAISVERSFRLYGDALRVAPVDGIDSEALKALLYEQPATGERHEMLRYQIEALGQTVAHVAGHEIGHSLGLAHTARYTPGSIMNSVVLIGPGADLYFLPEALGILATGLPGAGRDGVSSQKVGVGGGETAALLMPEGGVHACSQCGR